MVNHSVKHGKGSFTELALKCKTDRQCLNELINDPRFRQRAKKMCQFTFWKFNERGSYGRTAEDLEQELYKRVLIGIGTYKGTAAFEALLHRIAINIELDEIKARNGLNQVELDESSKIKEVKDTEQEAVLYVALERLSPEDRKLIQARAEGCNIEQIAEQIGLKKSQAHRKLAKATERLYQYLYGDCAE